MKTIIIVREGRFGLVEPKEYEEIIDLLKDALEEVAQVKIFPTAQDVKKILQNITANVVFVSRGAQKEAESIAKEFPDTKVFIFSGLLPDGERDGIKSKSGVIWVAKGATSLTGIKRMAQ